MSIDRRDFVKYSAGAVAASTAGLAAGCLDVSVQEAPERREASDVPEPIRDLRPMLDGIVPLPHAKRRLRLKDPARVGLFARRFAPALCAALDEGTRLDRTDERWRGVHNARRLTEQGSVVRIPGEG